MTQNPVPPHCPSCGASMIIVKLECSACGTEITGEYEVCPVCRLDENYRKVFEIFMRARGNLRKVQHELDVSYPTARLRIEEMFAKLGHSSKLPDPKAVLAKVRSGELDVDAAEKLLRGDKKDIESI